MMRNHTRPFAVDLVSEQLTRRVQYDQEPGGDPSDHTKKSESSDIRHVTF